MNVRPRRMATNIDENCVRFKEEEREQLIFGAHEMILPLNLKRKQSVACSIFIIEQE